MSQITDQDMSESVYLFHKLDPQFRKDCTDSLIQECSNKTNVALDLSRQGLKDIPEKLLQLEKLEYLYLEGNNITCLPENFFDSLPYLQWLDLRNNNLQTLPSAYIGRHQCLRNLLLEGNNLVTLPLELGLVTTLNGLNIRNNPLDFPPEEVIERGTQMVLVFLREVLKAKTLGKIPAVPKIEDLKIDSETYSSEDEGSYDHQNSRNNSSQNSSKYSRRGSDLPEFRRTSSENSELGGPILHSASLQQRANYNELKQQQTDKLRKAGALGMLEKVESSKSLKSKKLAKLSQYPEPPPPQHVLDTYHKEKRLARLRQLRDKQEMVLQRRRDQDVLTEWQDESKLLQRAKYQEKLARGKLDFDEPATHAPFAVEKNHLRMQTNEERIAQDIREKHEKIRRTASPGAQQRIEEERELRDRELQKKLKEHTQQMNDRRMKPKGTPQEEMTAAKKELKIAEQMHRELEQRRKALEYRFTAFTGDSIL